jgi:hypothetical protein
MQEEYYIELFLSRCNMVLGTAWIFSGRAVFRHGSILTLMGNPLPHSEVSIRRRQRPELFGNHLSNSAELELYNFGSADQWDFEYLSTCSV